jgi:hypothetical protein
MNREFGQMSFIQNLLTKLMVLRYNDTFVEPQNSLVIYSEAFVLSFSLGLLLFNDSDPFVMLLCQNNIIPKRSFN